MSGTYLVAFALLGLLSAWTCREGPLTLTLLVVLLVFAAVERVVAGRSRGIRSFDFLIPGAVALALPLTRTDLMALLVSIWLIRTFDSREARAVILSATLFTIGGSGPFHPVYLGCTLATGLLLIPWLAGRHREGLRAVGAGVFPPGQPGFRFYLTASIALVIGGITMYGLPGLSRMMVEIPMGSATRSTGFGKFTDLNCVSSLKSSPALALRLFAPGPRLLKGVAYYEYRKGYWLAPRVEIQTLLHDAAELEDLAGAGVERVESLYPGERALFVPREASQVRAPGHRVLGNDLGAVFTTQTPLDTYQYRMGPGGAGPGSGPSPGPEFLGVPEEVRTALEPLAREWSRGVRGDRALADTFQGRLQSGYTYSLSPGSPRGREPVVRFLRETRTGHCEYFASSLALLLRLVGIPTRYASGYSVSVRSRFGDYLIGRDADAHAWVEVHLKDRGWTTYDPTPAGWRDEGPSPATLWAYDAKDHLSYLVSRLLSGIKDRITRLLARLVPGAPAPVAAGILVLLGLLVRFLVRSRELLIAFFQRLRARSDRFTRGAPPPVDVVRGRLERILADHGLVRQRSATLMDLSGQVERSEWEPERKDAARDLIDRICRALYREDPFDAEAARRSLDRLTPGPGA